MTCDRHYTHSTVSELQHIAALIRFRNLIHVMVAKRRAELPSEYGSGLIDGLELALILLEESTPVVMQAE